MFGYVDLNAILLGLVFGLVFSASIVAFLIHAAVNVPQTEEDQAHAARIARWSPISKYESRRTYLHVAGHDADFEW